MTGSLAHLGSVHTFCDRATAAKELAVAVMFFACVCVSKLSGVVLLRGNRKCMNFDRREKVNSI